MEETIYNNWQNGNFSDLSKADLIKLCRYFENKTKGIHEEIEPEE